MHEVVVEYFRQYYEKHGEKLADESIVYREVAWGDWESKVVARHRKFNSLSLKKFLVRVAPAHVSHSLAYYKYPQARDMEAKQLFRADWVFELDADEIIHNCMVNPHRGCERILLARGSRVYPPEVYYAFQDITADIVYMLKDELGIKEVSVNFSGNRGFHVRVYDEDWGEILSPRARGEVVRYLEGKADPKCLLHYERGELRGPKPSDPSWHGRVAMFFLARLNEGEEELVKMGLPVGVAKELVSKRTEIIRMVSEGKWSFADPYTAQEILKYAIESLPAPVIDKKVATDPRHLIRFKNSLHGGTGLIAGEVNLDRILSTDYYDPLRDFVFKDYYIPEPIKVKLKEKVKLEIGDVRISGVKGSEVKVPVYAGVFLMLKNLGDIIDTPGQGIRG